MCYINLRLTYLLTYCQSIERKKYHIPQTCWGEQVCGMSPQPHPGLPTLSLTNKGSRLPWWDGGLASLSLAL